MLAWVTQFQQSSVPRFYYQHHMKVIWWRIHLKYKLNPNRNHTEASLSVFHLLLVRAENYRSLVKIFHLCHSGRKMFGWIFPELRYWIDKRNWEQLSLWSISRKINFRYFSGTGQHPRYLRDLVHLSTVTFAHWYFFSTCPFFRWLSINILVSSNIQLSVLKFKSRGKRKTLKQINCRQFLNQETSKLSHFQIVCPK